jgi:hypothetical protein
MSGVVLFNLFLAVQQLMSNLARKFTQRKLFRRQSDEPGSPTSVDSGTNDTLTSFQRYLKLPQEHRTALQIAVRSAAVQGQMSEYSLEVALDIMVSGEGHPASSPDTLYAFPVRFSKSAQACSEPELESSKRDNDTSGTSKQQIDNEELTQTLSGIEQLCRMVPGLLNWQETATSPSKSSLVGGRDRVRVRTTLSGSNQSGEQKKENILWFEVFRSDVADPPSTSDFRDALRARGFNSIESGV